jgi:low affinity Fe/Cu permease
MSASSHFQLASKADFYGKIIFCAVFMVSLVLAIFPNPQVEAIGHPLLVAFAVLAIISTIVTTIQQTEGNRALRASQLTDALGAKIGEVIRADYYNNDLTTSVRRLAATTMENALFTKEILSKMAIRERTKNGAYLILLLILSVCRQTPTSWILIIAQTLFSADLILKWIRLERFRNRANRVYEGFQQFFLQEGDTNKPNHMAILLAGFTDYECAKDEAVLPLDEKIFQKLNPALSVNWQQTRERLGIK